MEDILESIKKVIARDSRDDAAQTRARRDLGPALAAASAPRPAPADVLDLTEVAAQIMAGDRAFALDDSEDHEGADEDAPLLPETTATSMRESLAALAMLSEPGVPPQIVRSGETSLEGLVREMLRPMLSDWLDKNLPPMVEKMVAAEIARIVGKKG